MQARFVTRAIFIEIQGLRCTWFLNFEIKTHFKKLIIKEVTFTVNFRVLVLKFTFNLHEDYFIHHNLWSMLIQDHF